MIATGSQTRIKFSKPKKTRDGFTLPVEFKVDSVFKVDRIKNDLRKTVDDFNGLHRRGRSKRLKGVD